MKRIAAVLWLILSACSSAAPASQPATAVAQAESAVTITAAAPQLPPRAQPTVTAGASAALTPTIYKESMRTDWLGCLAEAQQSLRFPQPDPSLAGLVFMNENRLWRVLASGTPALLSCVPPADGPAPGVWLSNGGSRVAFSERGAIWLAEVMSGYVRRVSPAADEATRFHFAAWSADDRFILLWNEARGPDGASRAGSTWLYEVASGSLRAVSAAFAASQGGIQQWPGRPDWLIYLTPPRPEEAGAEVIGYLTAQNISTGGENRLVKPLLWNQIAISQDGTKIVYHSASQDDFNWYWWGDGKVVRLPVTDYKVPGWKISEAFNPLWSPDGKRLAMLVHARQMSGDAQPVTGIAVLNLAQAAGVLLHPFQNAGPSEIRWSPDRQWIALAASDFDPTRSGLWLLKTDGSREIHYPDIPGVPSFAWSPDSQALVLANACGREGQSCIIRAPGWQAEPLPWRADEIVRWDQGMGLP